MKHMPVSVSLTKSHKMTPDYPTNLEQLIETYQSINKFILCPVEISIDKKSINPYIAQGIHKTELIIQNVWKIGENDPDRMGIAPEDNPIIPADQNNAPVLKILKKLNKLFKLRLLLEFEKINITNSKKQQIYNPLPLNTNKPGQKYWHFAS